MQDYHKPVLLNEVLALIDPKPGGVFVDATCGGGGHSEEILKKILPQGLLIGIDKDSEALNYAKERLKKYSENLILVKSNFSDLLKILKDQNIEKIDGILFDLGVSSHQLDSSRGFSFMRDEQLDMRMDKDEDIPTAKDIVNFWSKESLVDIFRKYGEERYSEKIASAILERRKNSPIETTLELANIIKDSVPSKYRYGDIHPATRVFQAIRIAVNSELEIIETAIKDAVEVLKIEGKICVISFHSLEDRIVKETFKDLSGRCKCPKKIPVCVCGTEKIVEIITSKPIVPSDDEVRINRRSRSAKLRCAKKVK
ncbi:MAG: 16S rRNA (cytosine(1402)-N(4))-methyltransferase RsmH [Armatimonadota bacterium]